MVDHRRRAVLFGSVLAAVPGWGHRPTSEPGRQVVPDTVVTTTDELEAAFANLSAGETVFVAAENAPYRTTRWLDVDADGVTVVGPGVKELIKPADGANVGGVRIGHRDHCEDVVVSGLGYHGNSENQHSRARRRHGIVVRDADNVTVEGNLITRTHPYHRHNWGGSGISAEYGCSNVRILNNRIYDVGDRGVQLGGENLVVAGNAITDGFDRSVSCDAWAPDGSNHHARNAVITGNVLGGNPEGSLTGLGGNPRESDRGYVTVSHNVGFGLHKSFCHVGGRGSIRDFTIEGNVGVQEETLEESAINADVHSATNFTVTNNHFYDYGDHGIDLGPGISDFRISNNSIFDPENAGVRVSAAEHGTVESNYVKGGRPGVLLDGAAKVTVAANRIRNAAVAGIISRSGTPTNHEIRDNYIDTQDARWLPPAIVIEDSGNCVRRNHVNQNEGGRAAILEVPDAGDNLYADNWANNPNPWTITSPTSTVRNHAPPFDAHRGLADDDSDGMISVAFDKPYAARPKLEFGRVGGGIEDVEYATDDADNFAGATVTVGNPGGTVDLFVEGV